MRANEAPEIPLGALFVKPAMLLEFPHRRVHFPRRPLLMGILNINPDSFSGDGTLEHQETLDRARAIIREGGDCLDVGAESARTNRAAISVEEEIARLRPFLAAWPDLWKDISPLDAEQLFPPLLSINTWRPEVVRWAVEAGADLINDMSGLPTPENAACCAAGRSALLIMHTVGFPKQDHKHVRYDDVITAAENFFSERIQRATGAGLPRERILLDPGLGFAKTWEDDLRLCAAAGRLQKFQRPLLWPISRKGFLGRVVEEPDASQRDAATIGALTSCTLRGAHILRVHAVGPCYLALKTLSAVHRFI